MTDNLRRPADVRRTHSRSHAGALALAAAVVFSLFADGARADDAVVPTIRNAILLDVTHDAVLLSRNAQERIPPASMSKIFTHLMLFERLDEGRLTYEDTFPVSERAWRMRGSRTFLDLGSTPRVRDLMLGLAVQSGNDAAVAIAEGLFGTEEAFAREATRRLGEIGIVNTTIRNASGLPDPEHLTTVEDLALGASHILRRHRDHYWIFSEREFTWNNIAQKNRNPLLGAAGVDGMKTGWTTQAGYGLIASAERDGRRLVGVVAGAESARARERAMSELLAWGFESFAPVDPCEGVGVSIAVSGGRAETVDARPVETCPLLVERALARPGALSVKAVVVEPMPAPVFAGTQAGSIVVSAGETVLAERALALAGEVEALGFFESLWKRFGF